MEIYNSEEQQVEAIKQWWAENGKSIIAGTVLGLLGLFGWRYYTEYREGQQETASAEYAQLMEQMQAGGEAAIKAGSAFVAAHKDTYGDLAALQLASVAIAQEQLPLAAEQLKRVATTSANAELKPLATLRLARVLGAQGEYAPALNLLDELKEPAYTGLVAEVRGDLFLLQGEKDKARTAYQAALAAAGINGNPAVTAKLDDLASAEDSADAKPQA
ncbi:MAG: tetratricopeptide repeat protein [Aeromonadaceae bacterium]|nr:tetratricopeptide repeat protein [Aeromonadaceae bacterium]